VNKKLRQELLGMVERDQEARRAIAPDGGPGADPDSEEAMRMCQVDDVNTARMREIIEEHGWPGRSLVGEDGADAAWLLVQHADAEREFQKHCLGLMTEAVGAGEARADLLAYLTDRVLVGEGELQRYGTQLHRVDGKWAPFALADEEQVDQRRAAVGLGPLADYVAGANEGQA